MRLLLYVLTAWVALSFPAALFFGSLCLSREDSFDPTARPRSTPSDAGDHTIKAA